MVSVLAAVQSSVSYGVHLLHPEARPWWGGLKPGVREGDGGWVVGMMGYGVCYVCGECEKGNASACACVCMPPSLIANCAVASYQLVHILSMRHTHAHVQVTLDCDGFKATFDEHM